MPIYEYQCEKCHHHLEALQKFSDKPLRECPECGRHSLKRMISAPMFRLAGSGWYETDFKSDNERKRNLVGKDEAPAETSPKDSGDKAEAKPEKAEQKKTVVTKPAPKSRPAKAKAKPKAPAKKAAVARSRTRR
jgi:putative FmdB family regulatory protein